jgi:hypothetical protein
MSSLTSYYTFYLIDKFGVSVSSAQMYLFLFLPPLLPAPSWAARSATASAASA